MADDRHLNDDFVVDIHSRRHLLQMFWMILDDDLLDFEFFPPPPFPFPFPTVEIPNVAPLPSSSPPSSSPNPLVSFL